jgi:hypothetical protein
MKPTHLLLFASSLYLIHPRPANVDIIHSNATAREILKKADPSTVFFCAILKEYDATSATYTNETLDADIAHVTNNQSPEHTNKIQYLLRKNKSICKPLETLLPLRPSLDHSFPLTHDSTATPGKSTAYLKLN